MEDLGQISHPTGTPSPWRSWRNDLFSLLQIWLQCTLIIFSSTWAVLAVGVDVSQECFALFLLQLQLFTPRILLLHSFHISQDSRISKALVLNYTEMFIKQPSTIFNVCHAIIPQFLQEWGISRLTFLWWTECATFHWAIYASQRDLPPKESVETSLVR